MMSSKKGNLQVVNSLPSPTIPSLTVSTMVNMAKLLNQKNITDIEVFSLDTLSKQWN